MNEVLVLYHDADPETFCDTPANRILADGFARAGLSFRLGKIGVMPHLDGIDAVLVWWYRPRLIALSAAEGLAFEARVAEACAARGIPMINRTRGAGLHSYCLEAWARAGIPCGRAQKFEHLDDICLPYPLVLRLDGGNHSSKDSFMAADRAEADAILARRAQGRRPPLNLAVTFIDTRYPDGTYRKWRVLVVGDRLVADDVFVSHHWCVKMGCALPGAVSTEENRRFLEEGPCNPELVLRAARALNQDITALDYSVDAAGRYVFWEGNRRAGMIDLEDDLQTARYRALVGRSLAAVRAPQRDLGDALAQLVRRRAGHVHGRGQALVEHKVWER